MFSVNSVTLLGNLGSDPEVRSTTTGTSVCNFSVATDERWKDKSGQNKEKVEWHRIAAFGANADVCVKYLKKGSRIYIEGHLQTNSFEDKNGVKKSATVVVLEKIIFLDGGGDRDSDPDGDGGHARERRKERNADGWHPPAPASNEDLPF